MARENRDPVTRKPLAVIPGITWVETVETRWR